MESEERSGAGTGDRCWRRRLLAETLDAAGFLVVVFDRSGRYLDANGSARALLGCEPEEPLELKVGDLAVRASAAAAIRRQLREHGVAEGEIDVRSLTGEPYRLGFLAGAVRGADDLFVGIGWLDPPPEHAHRPGADAPDQT